MAIKLFDRVRETSTTTGTGNFALLGAVSSYVTFSSVMGSSSFYYVIAHQSANEWEVGVGTVSSTTLTRVSVFASSNANAAVSFSAGTKDVFCDAPADLVLQTTANRDICQGRLTLTTGVPVTSGSVANATTVYYTPYLGNCIALYDGVSHWKLMEFVECSLAVPATTLTPYDIFVQNVSGTLTMSFVAWTNTTTRATAPVLQDGIRVSGSDSTKRYVGSFCSYGTGVTQDSLVDRLLWNQYNRVQRRYIITDSTASWVYSTAAWRQSNNNPLTRLSVMVGYAETMVSLNFVMNAFGAGNGTIGIGINSTTVNSADVNQMCNASGSNVSIQAALNYHPAAGYSYFQCIEYGNVAGITFQGNALGGVCQYGMTGNTWA